jgi:hypothetical protein
MSYGAAAMILNVTQSIFNEVAEFLVSQPTLEAFAAYQVSPGVQQQIDTLLDKNNEAGLTSEERLELEKILAVTHVLDMTKIKAKLKLAGKA